MNEYIYPVEWPGWERVRLICGHGSGSLWELRREDGKGAATVKYISIPRSSEETGQLLRQGKTREHIGAYYEYLCRSVDEEYAVSEELKDCRHVALYRDIRKVRAADGLGWTVLLMMDKLLPVDQCITEASEAEVLKLGRQICLALEDSDRCGLLHGRISPRCIFRDDTGNYQLGGFAGEHVSDLGDFRAPEVAENRFCDTRADVYSLGMVLYWLLNDSQLPENDRKAPKNGSERLKAVIMKAIAPKVEDRYQTPAELGAALKALSPKKTSKTKKKNPMKALLAAAAVLLVLMNVLIFGKTEDPEEMCADGHSWEAATCTAPKTCKVCGETQGIAADHSWEAATCTAPKTCKVCGETQGIAADHSWEAATCTNPKTCKVCGETQGITAEHSWQAASCIAPKTCRVCGKTEGTLKEHNWIAATYSSPKTCSVCGQTEGSALRSEPKSLTEFEITAAVGKVWIRGTAPYYRGSYHTRADVPDCWKDWSKPGYTGGTIKDNQGNTYDSAIHIDGWDSCDYYYEIRLDGKYTTFSGVCACPEKSAVIFGHVYDATERYMKYFEVYGDGKLLFTSATMCYDYPPRSFEVDVTGVQVLRILYPGNGAPNETASIFDGMLS